MATIETPETDASRARRYSQAAVLLRKWMAEDSEYDQRVGALLEQELAENKVRCREHDEPAA